MPLSQQEIVRFARESYIPFFLEAYQQCPFDAEDYNALQQIAAKFQKNSYGINSWQCLILRSGNLTWIKELLSNHEIPTNAIYDILHGDNAQCLAYALDTLEERYVKAATPKGGGNIALSAAHESQLECLRVILTHPKYGGFFANSKDNYGANVAHHIARDMQKRQSVDCLAFVLAHFPLRGLDKTKRGIIITRMDVSKGTWDKVMAKVKALNPNAVDTLNALIDAPEVRLTASAAAKKRKEMSSHPGSEPSDVDFPSTDLPESEQIIELKHQLRRLTSDNRQLKSLVETLTKVNHEFEHPPERDESDRVSIRALIARRKRRVIGAGIESHQSSSTTQHDARQVGQVSAATDYQSSSTTQRDTRQVDQVSAVTDYQSSSTTQHATPHWDDFDDLVQNFPNIFS